MLFDQLLIFSCVSTMILRYSNLDFTYNLYLLKLPLYIFPILIATSGNLDSAPSLPWAFPYKRQQRALQNGRSVKLCYFSFVCCET